MRTLFANIYKDICLFVSASGILGLILPVLMAAAMLIGFSDTTSADLSVRPFEVAVYDRDQTVMSRSLLSQLKKVELFSNVYVYDDEQLEAAASRGTLEFDANGDIAANASIFDAEEFSNCAAVITVPEDFFYDAYTASEKNVKVILNGRMQAEGALTSSMIRSIAGILSSERAAWYAAYSVKAGGEFDPVDFEAFCDDSAQSIIDSALGRMEVFSNINSEDDGDNIANTFFACSVSMLFFLVSIGVLKTLPDEKRIGISDRFVSIGGSRFSLLASKLIAALVFCSAGTAPLIILLRPNISIGFVIILISAFFACFFIILALFGITGSTESFMLIGGAITVVSLLLGGVIYPHALMPDIAVKLGSFTVPFCIESSFGAGKSMLENNLLRLIIIALAAITIHCLIRFSNRRSFKRRGAAR